MAQPSVFVGSSSEGLVIARAIQEQLSSDATVVTWDDDDTFGLSESTIESLFRALDRYDFAIIVLTPDDVTVSRGLQQFAPRDNLLFEFGLFMASLGRDRTYAVLAFGSDVKVPSDLNGVAFAVGKVDSSSDRILSGLGPACSKIRRRLDELGPKVKREQEIGVLYRLINACTGPLYPDVRVEFLDYVRHRTPEAFQQLEDVVDFIHDLLIDYVRPLLTDRQMKALRVYFAYYLGDGIIFDGRDDLIDTCVDVDALGREFAGEFVIGISNPDSFAEEGWRVGRAIPGYSGAHPLSNCALVFKDGRSNYRNNLSIAWEGTGNYDTADEKSVYTVPVQWRSHHGNASVGVIAVSSKYPNYIPDPLKVRVELLGNVIGYIFSMYAVGSLDGLDEEPGPLATIGMDTKKGGNSIYRRQVTNLRRQISAHFESSFIRMGRHQLDQKTLRVTPQTR